MEMFVVGVDGGATKTIALAADGRGNVLGAARGPGSSCIGSAVEEAMGIAVATVRDALHQAHLSAGETAVGVFGLAGADWPEDYDRRLAVLQRSGVAKRILVKNDAVIGLRAGTNRGYGLVIAAGTGCNAGIVAPDGREWLYGFRVGRGGGWSLAQGMIEAVLRADDGRGDPTVLTEYILQTLGFEAVEDMLRSLRMGQLARGLILSLCPLVFEAADAGDEVAAGLITEQGHILAEYATALIRRFGMRGLEFEVVLSGGVFKGKGPLLVDIIRQDIQQVAPHCTVLRARFEPVIGAILLAYDAEGTATTGSVCDNLVRTSPAAEFFSTISC